jgi:putative transposase
MTGISKSQVSRLCGEIDDKVKAVLARSIEGDWRYLWIDAACVKVRQNGRIVPVAVSSRSGSTAIAGARFSAWTSARPRPRRSGPRFCASSRDAAFARRQASQLRLPMRGSKAAVSKVLNATWQRCRVHFMRNALAYAGMSGRRVVSAFIATAFAEDDAEAARAQWRRIADHLRPKLPKLAAFLDTFSPLKSYPPKHELVLQGPILDQIHAGSISNDRNDQDVLESIA